MRKEKRLQPPIRVDLAATPRRPRNDSDNPSRGAGRNACAACLHPEGGREGREGREGGREGGQGEGGRERNNPPRRSSLVLSPRGTFLPPTPPSRWHVAAVHIDSDYPSQFEKADGAGCWPEAERQTPTFGSGEERGGREKRPARVGPRLTGGSRVRSESLSESIGQGPLGWAARWAEMRGDTCCSSRSESITQATPRRPRNDSEAEEERRRRRGSQTAVSSSSTARTRRRQGGGEETGLRLRRRRSYSAAYALHRWQQHNRLPAAVSLAAQAAHRRRNLLIFAALAWPCLVLPRALFS